MERNSSPPTSVNRTENENMAKTKTKTEGPRILTCERTGVKFEYKGYGRPPKYCPAEAEKVRKEQRAASQKAKRAATGSKRKRDVDAAMVAV